MRREEFEKLKEEVGTQFHNVQSDLDFIMRKLLVEYPGKKVTACLHACVINVQINWTSCDVMIT